MKEEILKLRNEGKTYNEIIDILNCSKGTISYHCKNIDNNNDIRKKNIIIKNINKKINFGVDLDESRIKEVIFYRKRGYSYRKLHERTNISFDKIKKICREFNLIDQTEFQKPTQLEIEEMQKYYDEVKSMRKVGDKFGWSKFTVAKYIVKINKNKLTPEEYKKKRKLDVSKNVVNWRKRAKENLVEYKGGCCQICGYKKSIGALQFHHMDPEEKDFTVSAKSYAYERLKKEVDKCVLLCSNCHIEVHEELKNIGYSEILNKLS